jgi:hypothetical protein
VPRSVNENFASRSAARTGVAEQQRTIDDAQLAERRNPDRPALLLRLRLAELPGRPAVCLALESSVEGVRMQFTNTQNAAAVRLQQIAVAELEARFPREDHVRRFAPFRRTDLDPAGLDPHAAEQADADAGIGVVAEDDPALEGAAEPALRRTDEERPARRFAEADDHEHRRRHRTDEPGPAHASDVQAHASSSRDCEEAVSGAREGAAIGRGRPAA